MEGDADCQLLPEDIVGYNAQGYNFDTLAHVPNDPTKFGWEIDPSDGYDSEVLRYWRHSFRAWEELHKDHGDIAAVKGFAPDDPYYWHTDGTPHVDHHRLLIAVRETFFKARKIRVLSRRTVRLRISTQTGPNFKKSDD